jgi:hypothetical protein
MLINLALAEDDSSLSSTLITTIVVMRKSIYHETYDFFISPGVGAGDPLRGLTGQAQPRTDMQVTQHI